MWIKFKLQYNEMFRNLTQGSRLDFSTSQPALKIYLGLAKQFLLTTVDLKKIYTFLLINLVYKLYKMLKMCICQVGVLKCLVLSTNL